QSGDTVEISTSPSQIPKLDWLNFVVTTKARNKIKQTINELNNRVSELGKELLQRRFKNRKIDIDEAMLMRTIKKLGYRTVTDFYTAIGNEQLDITSVIAEYDAIERAESGEKKAEGRSAEEFSLQYQEDNQPATDDILIIGDNIKGINYRLS
ncbi:MAG TPA: RelA/SpoT family protein, partial [Porphyromonadaceae bacterium]|nr:RelA/SpoT family protein [Porphyromonadaceae bacterium]